MGRQLTVDARNRGPVRERSRHTGVRFPVRGFGTVLYATDCIEFAGPGHRWEELRDGKAAGCLLKVNWYRQIWDAGAGMTKTEKALSLRRIYRWP